MKNKTKGLLFIGALFLGVSLFSVSAKANTLPQIKKLVGSDRYATAVELSKKQFSSANAICIVNGTALPDGLSITPLGTYYKAPILLSKKDSLPQSTKDEIKRLNAKKAFIGGSEGVVSQNVVNELKSLGVTEIVRLGGTDRYDTALEIAKYLDSNAFPIKEVVVAYGYGEADSLSIASVAGNKQMAIILTPKDKLKDNTYEWLKSKNLTNAYIIGGDSVVSNETMNKVDSITSNDISNNRLGGSDRYETNAKVIEKFFPSELSEAYVAKGWDGYLIDALSSGVISSLNNAPVIILNNTSTVKELQEQVLEPKSSKLLYEVGGGLNQDSVQRVNELLGIPTETQQPNGLTGAELDTVAESYGWIREGKKFKFYDHKMKIGGLLIQGNNIDLHASGYSSKFEPTLRKTLNAIIPDGTEKAMSMIESGSEGSFTANNRSVKISSGGYVEIR